MSLAKQITEKLTGGRTPTCVFCAPILFFLFSEKEKNRRSVRRSLLHSASAGAAKAPYSQSPSSFPKADRCAGSPFGSNKKRKETTGEPFEWFPGSSIDQSLALDLRRMEVGKPTIEYVGADAERSCSRRRSVTDAACPSRVLIGPLLQFCIALSFLNVGADDSVRPQRPPLRQKKPAAFRFRRGGENSISAAFFFLPKL